MDRVIVIGSGLAGLASAVVLGARGYAVTVVEKNEWTGGKACVLEQDGYRFDMGPTILTIPAVLRRIFAEAGVALEERLQLVRLDPQWRCFFEDGSRLDLVEDVQRMQAILRDYSPHPEDAEGYRAFLSVSEALNEISQRFFFWRPVGGLFDILDPKSWLTAEGWNNFMRIRPGKTVANTVRSHIKDERVAQMLDHFVQYVGSSPEQSPAVLCGIAHMQTDEGVWYPMGGTRAVPVTLRKLAEELGVEFRTGVAVKRILVDGHQAQGVELETGEMLLSRAVVSNMDAVRTFRELLPSGPEARKANTPACSGVVLYLGLKRRYEHLLHHDFVFSRNAEDEFHHIYHKGEPAPDPSLYLAAPAVTDPSVAPAGGDALYVLAHTPYLRPHHDWKKMLPAYRQVMLDKLKSCAGLTDIEDNIAFEAHLTPQDIHDRYAVLNGAIYGVASHGNMGAFKASNRTRYAGLYLAGGAAHPGPGMPMTLMSGWIAADALHQDGRVEPRVKTAR
jgi:diapolycopene oxygenase